MSESCLQLKVEISPGTDIQEASREACKLATLIGVDVDFDFNGCLCIAQPNAKAEDLIGEYYLSLNSGRDYRMAFARSRNPKGL